MNLDSARRLLLQIPEEGSVIDVGGGAAPFPRANFVLDALAFDDAGAGSNGNAHHMLGVTPRYNRERWVRLDMCDRAPWPFADKSFDFAVCSHLLEDVRDPIWICSELCRIAKAGYIEVPSRTLEQSRGVEHPHYAGYGHHRWLINIEGNRLLFRHKPHLLHSASDAIVADLSPGRRINPALASISLDWSGHFEAHEVLEFNEQRTIDELCAFAGEARLLPELTVGQPMPLMARIKRHVYYHRLATGGGGRSGRR